MQKKAPIMRRTQMLTNYADLHRCILSDALEKKNEDET